MKKVLFLLAALALCLPSCVGLQKTDTWQTVCELENEKPAKSFYLVSNIGDEDFVQCRIQSMSYNQWQDIEEWPECEDLDAGESISKSVGSKHRKLRLQIGTHKEIQGWCTIIQKK